MALSIVSSEWLAERLLEPKVKVIEVSAKARQEAAYAVSHIPGAVNFFWKDLCWHETDRQFVTPAELAQRLGAVGISEQDRVVVYGEPVQYGTYALWALTMAGHPALHLLDGSRAKWIADGRPLTDVVPNTNKVEYIPKTGDTSMRLGRDNILQNLGKAKRLLLDLRSPEEYSGARVMEYGQFDHGAERGGRIPGAKHLYFRELLNDDDTFKSAELIRERLASIGCEPDKFDEIVCYCRLSHRATIAWTAMTHILGCKNVFIYDGSWTEWGSIVGFPVER